MSISASTAGHIIGKAIAQKELRRLRKGEYTFDAMDERVAAASNEGNTTKSLCIFALSFFQLDKSCKIRMTFSA